MPQLSTLISPAQAMQRAVKGLANQVNASIPITQYATVVGELDKNTMELPVKLSIGGGVVKAVLSMPPNYYTHIKSGDVVLAITTDYESVSGFLNGLEVINQPVGATNASCFAVPLVKSVLAEDGISSRIFATNKASVDVFENGKITIKNTKTTITIGDDGKLTIVAGGDVSVEAGSNAISAMGGSIALEASGDVSIKGGSVTLEGSSIKANSDLIATLGNISLATHTHFVTATGAESAPPTPSP